MSARKEIVSVSHSGHSDVSITVDSGFDSGGDEDVVSKVFDF